MKKSSTLLNLLSVLLLAVAVVAVIFFVNPMQVDVDDMRLQLAEKEAELVSLTSQVADLEAMKDELGSSGVSEEKLLLQVPEGASQDQLIDDMAALASEAGVDLHGMSFSDTLGDQTGAIAISASFDGDYQDLIGFLESVEKNGRKLRVRSINVQLSEESAVARANFSLLIEAYYQ